MFVRPKWIVVHLSGAKLEHGHDRREIGSGICSSSVRGSVIRLDGLVGRFRWRCRGGRTRGVAPGRFSRSRLNVAGLLDRARRFDGVDRRHRLQRGRRDLRAGGPRLRVTTGRLVVGYDNTSLAALLCISLTTVDQPQVGDRQGRRRRAAGTGPRRTRRPGAAPAAPEAGRQGDDRAAPRHLTTDRAGSRSPG